MAETDLTFDRSRPAPLVLERVSPGIRRFAHDNAGAFTFTGTCSYVIGQGRVAVIDPGPEGGAQRLIAALSGETIEAILVTHTHRDHSPAARRLKALTGAPILGCGPHGAARPPVGLEQVMLDASADADHAPDRLLADGEAVTAGGAVLVAVATPGHTMNHLAFALPEERALFSGDHVMAWSTTIVAPPDGAMGPYMASLERLRGRDDRIYWPGHGGPVSDPPRFLRGLIGHRRMREAAILGCLETGMSAIPEIVAKLYAGVDPALHGAAALSVLAHLEDAVARGLVRAEGAGLRGIYRPA
jgi:glyoxylase-like metal-dependent hydrolase (beta-lactamase superfamily II)